METSLAEQKIFHLIIARPPLDAEVRKMGHIAGEAFRRAQHRANLLTLAQEVEEKILPAYGGIVIDDGSSYEQGNYSNDMVTVKTTVAGFRALQKLPQVNRITETIDLEKLIPDAAPGTTNIRPGLFWERSL